MQLPLISVNGIFDAAISPLDRGFAYGDGLFETCRYQSGRIPLWPYHRERLLASAHRLKIPVDEKQLTSHLDGLFQRLQSAAIHSAVVKIQLTRGVGGRGYRVPDSIQPTYCIGAYSVAPLITDAYRSGVAVRICTQRLALNPALAGMKHLNRLEQILARAEWQDEFAEGLLLDAAGMVIEGTVSNLFLIKGACLYTPDLTFAGVEGVMRRAIMEKFAPQLSLDIKVVPMNLDFIYAADELFLSNSVYGIWPIHSLIDQSQPALEPKVFCEFSQTRRLQNLIEHIYSATD